MTRSAKTALAVAILGLGFIITAGVMTALDHFRFIAPIDCRVTQVSKSATPEVLDVTTGQAAGSPLIQLGKPVCVTVAGLAQPPLDAKHPDVDVALFIDGNETPAHRVAAATPDAQALLFTIEPATDAKSDDAVRLRELLHGMTGGSERIVRVGVGLRDAARPLAQWNPKPGQGPARVRIFSPTIGWIAGAGFILLLVAIFFANRDSGLLRDGDATSTYSLGRYQMAFWMIATVFGFVFIWVLTGQYRNIITTSAFTLLGITGATALTTRVIDDGTTPKKSKGFIVDVLSDDTGVKLHRVQVVIWTLVLGTIFIWNVLDTLTLTDFDANLLILVGIANGVYAGFKTKEA